MKIQCTCGKVQIELKMFPENTPGRLMCYCDDCQKYLLHLGRTDLLDASGGSEIIPVYPADATLIAGAEHLKCTRLAEKGMYRWSTTCCNAPVGNTRSGQAWLGVHRIMFAVHGPQYLERTVGTIRAGIMGKFAKGPVPSGTPAKMNLKAAIPVLPFMLKGMIRRKANPSPFVQPDGVTPVAPVRTLTTGERDQLQQKWAGIKSYR